MKQKPQPVGKPRRVRSVDGPEHELPTAADTSVQELLDALDRDFGKREVVLILQTDGSGEIVEREFTVKCELIEASLFSFNTIGECLAWLRADADAREVMTRGYE